MVEYLAEKAVAALDWVSSVVLVLAFPLLIAFAIDPVRVWLEDHGIFSERSIIAVSALAVISTLIVLRAQTRRLTNLMAGVDLLHAKVRDLQPTGGAVGPTNLAQQFVLTRVRALTDPHRKEAYLIAQNLTGSIPLVIPILEDSDLHDWKVHIFCIDPDIDHGRVPAEWRGLVRDMTSMLVNRLRELRSQLVNRRVQVNLTYYAHLPVVHGLLLADGSLVMTVARWNEDGTMLGDADFYDIHDANDLSPHAEGHRKLFRNWLATAARNARPAIFDNEIVAESVPAVLPEKTDSKPKGRV